MNDSRQGGKEKNLVLIISQTECFKSNHNNYCKNITKWNIFMNMDGISRYET